MKTLIYQAKVHAYHCCFAFMKLHPVPSLSTIGQSMNLIAENFGKILELLVKSRYAIIFTTALAFNHAHRFCLQRLFMKIFVMAEKMQQKMKSNK